MTQDPRTELESAVALLAQFVLDTSALAERRTEPRARHRLETAVSAARATLRQAVDDPALAVRFARMPAPQR